MPYRLHTADLGRQKRAPRGQQTLAPDCHESPYTRSVDESQCEQVLQAVIPPDRTTQQHVYRYCHPMGRVSQILVGTKVAWSELGWLLTVITDPMPLFRESTMSPHSYSLRIQQFMQVSMEQSIRNRSALETKSLVNTGRTHNHGLNVK